MKVLFITRKFPPSIGGMELFAHDLSQALSSEVKLRLVKWGGSNKALPLVLPWLFLQSCWNLATGKIDVIHVQDGLLSPFGYVLAKLFRKPFVVVIHGLDITFQNPLYQRIVPWAVRRADRVICISSAAAKEAKQRGVGPEIISVVPIAVEDKLHGKATRSQLLQALELPSDAQLLITVGRLVKRKGVAWFIEAVLPGLIKEHDQLKYVVIGEGGERQHIEAVIERTGLEKHVLLLGRVADDLYEAAYNGADVFVMPNIVVPGDIEGFGLVLLEASLCELPVVAAGIEGIRDAIVDGKNGKLVASRDAAGFMTAIDEFLNNRPLAKSFGQASRKYTLEHYRWAVIARQYVEIYEKLDK